jgi:hypothetical protein
MDTTVALLELHNLMLEEIKEVLVQIMVAVVVAVLVEQGQTEHP